MRLIGCGDSWCWGAELVDPQVEPIPIMKLPEDSFHLQYKPENMAYRLKYRYINQFAEKIKADELVDLSQCSFSNDAIARTLLEYLASNGYTTGRDTSDLFVSIGWTSPERREFYYKERWGGDNWLPFGPWSMDQKHRDPDIDKFMRLYFDLFWNSGEFIHRWITQLWYTEMLLKTLNIKYVMHQAFYHDHTKMIYQWDDKQYIDGNMTNKITDGDKILWENLDKVRFMHKDDPTMGTAHHYMVNKSGDVNKVFEVFHPNSYGHTLWADYMYQYCTENNLL